jgi:hypothetical protein
MKMYRKGGRRLLDNARKGGSMGPLRAQTGAIGDLTNFTPLVGQADRISTRFPTAAKATEDPLQDNLSVGIESMAADGPSFAKNIAFVREYDNYRPTKKELTDHEVAERFKQHVINNLLWLHDKMKPEVRERARRWYDGARRQAEVWAGQYGLKERQVAGVIAALSPQKDWFMNMSLAERMMDIWTTMQDHAMDDAMLAKGNEKFPAGGKTAAAKANRTIYDRIKGKTLASLSTDLERAMWVRMYDEAHNPRHHKVMSPEGEMLGYATNVGGEKSGTGWGSLAEIAKGVSMLRDDSLENISRQVGGQHKVRNFYSNIVSPGSELGEVTIDTHAVAAALIKPLSGKGYEVDQNFGSSSVKGRPGGASSSITGSKGTYGIYADAYREAAAQRGLKAREMQSIVWEEVRTLFEDTFKTEENAAKIQAVWKQYRNGRITQEQAQEKIHEYAGGTSDPEWFGRGAGSDEGVRGSTYKEELPGDGVSGRGAGDDGRAAGSTLIPRPSSRRLSPPPAATPVPTKASMIFLPKSQASVMRRRPTHGC